MTVTIKARRSEMTSTDLIEKIGALKRWFRGTGVIIVDRSEERRNRATCPTEARPRTWPRSL